MLSLLQRGFSAKPTEPQFTVLVVTGTPGTVTIKELDGDGFQDSFPGDPNLWFFK